MLPKSFIVSKYLFTVTFFPCPEGVTVTEDACITRRQSAASFAKGESNILRTSYAEVKTH